MTVMIVPTVYQPRFAPAIENALPSPKRFGNDRGSKRQMMAATALMTRNNPNVMITRGR